MNLQPAHPEHERQPDQAGEEPVYESLTDDPEFYKGNYGGFPLVGGGPGGQDPYLMRNRTRAVRVWAQGGASAKGLYILLGVVGGALIIAMLLLT